MCKVCKCGGWDMIMLELRHSGRESASRWCRGVRAWCVYELRDCSRAEAGVSVIVIFGDLRVCGGVIRHVDPAEMYRRAERLRRPAGGRDPGGQGERRKSRCRETRPRSERLRRGRGGASCHRSPVFDVPAKLEYLSICDIVSYDRLSVTKKKNNKMETENKRTIRVRARYLSGPRYDGAARRRRRRLRAVVRLVWRP